MNRIMKIVLILAATNLFTIPMSNADETIIIPCNTNTVGSTVDGQSIDVHCGGGGSGIGAGDTGPGNGSGGGTGGGSGGGGGLGGEVPPEEESKRTVKTA